jgi:hypothetical protein
VAPLAVDPEALSAAGNAVVAAGDGLDAAMAVLTASFGANTGRDAAGTVFGLAYQSAAESLLKVAVAAINACRYNGALIQLSASNYSKAEAASTLGGGTSVLQPPGEPVKIAAPGPPGTLGPGQPPPLLWALVQSFVDDAWPNGDVAALHAAAGCWRGFDAALRGMRDALNASKTLIGTQQIAEGEQIDHALSKMGAGMASLGEQCGKMAATLDDFANEVGHAQHAIRDLLHRLGSLFDLWHDVVSIFDGDAIDEIKKIAEDINAVLHNLGREARALEQGMKLGMQVLDGLIVGVEKDMRGQFTRLLGDDVGNPVATVFDTWVNANEGVLKDAVGTVQSMEDLDPRWFLIDPKGAAATWMGMTKTGLINDFLNPQEAGQANIQMFKSMLHLEDWRRDRPGLGAAENLFDVATLFLPGVGEAGAGVKGAGAAARGAEVGGEVADAAGTVGRGGRAAGDLGDLAGAGGALGEIGKVGSGLTKDFQGLAGDLPKPDPQLGDRPVGLPPSKPLEVPVEPTPRPPESAPPVKAPTESPTVPPGSAPPERPGLLVGPHEPASAPVTPGEQQPSTKPQLAEPAPAQVPASPGGPPVEPAPAAAAHRAPAPTPAAPHAPPLEFKPQGRRPPELPATGGGDWHGPGDGGSPGGYPHEPPPHGGGNPQGPGEGGPPGAHPPESPSHDGAPSGDEPHVEDPDGTGDKRHTISGHGGYTPAHGHINVPRGTTITVYAEHGSNITDALGNLIETRGDTSGVYSKTFLPGEQIPDYTIYPPDELNIMGTPQTVLNPTRLSELINEDMGSVDLAVCPYDATCPTGKVYDVHGIFDERAGTFQPYEGNGF